MNRSKLFYNVIVYEKGHTLIIGLWPGPGYLPIYVEVNKDIFNVIYIEESLLNYKNIKVDTLIIDLK